MEKILSIHIGHDSTAFYLDDSGYIGIAEERISRIKNFYGFPNKSISEIFQIKNVNWSLIDKLVITGSSLKKSKSYKNSFFFNFRSEDFSNNVSLKARFECFRYFFRNNLEFDSLLRQYLKDNGFKGKIKYYDHHLCHIASSYATYPIDNSILLSIDGGGDNVNWSIYKVENDKFRLINKSSNNLTLDVHDTPADIYSNTTKFLGFRRLRDEGKVMGLAANGKPIHKDYFDKILKFDGGKFICSFGSQRKNFIKKIRNLIAFFLNGTNYDLDQILDMKSYFKNKLYKRENICSSLQVWAEEITMKFLNFFYNKYNLKNRTILLSGGFFSNVLINQKIKESGLFRNVYVTPNMGDGGLALGGAYLTAPKKYKDRFFKDIKKNAFYGNLPNVSILKKYVEDFYIKKMNHIKLSKLIANALIDNKIIGIVNGEMEYGPRALGNRSIIANPAKENITDELNMRLNRSDFMPFAPIIRDCDADKILENYSKNDFSAKFMTTTYTVKKNLREKLKNIMHVDNTVRPQVVDKVNNKLCYSILNYFSKKTNIPALINTSFNVHEEPIVMHIEHAMQALDQEVIDLLIIDDFLVKKKN